MNGRTHALIGLATVPPTALSSGLSLPETAILSAVCAGFALGPDIDHPTSTITKALGKPLHHLAHGLSAAAITLLSSRADRYRFQQAEERGIDPMHRSLTHTLVFTVAMGGAGWLVGHSSLATALLAALCLVVCRKLVPGRWQASLYGAALAVLAFGAYADLTASQVGLAATAGWLSHVIADACTKAGVPLLWPMRIKGRNWWRFRPLGSWLESGHKKEYVPALGVVLVMNFPHFLLA